MKNTILIAMLAMISLTSCKFKPGCIIEDKATKVISAGISKVAECGRPDLVQEDILAGFQTTIGMCKKELPTGPIGMVVCPLISQWAVNQFAEQEKVAYYLKRWECTAKNAKQSAVTLLTTGCVALFPL